MKRYILPFIFASSLVGCGPASNSSPVTAQSEDIVKEVSTDSTLKAGLFVQRFMLLNGRIYFVVNNGKLRAYYVEGNRTVQKEIFDVFPFDLGPIKAMALDDTDVYGRYTSSVCIVDQAKSLRCWRIFYDEIKKNGEFVEFTNKLPKNLGPIQDVTLTRETEWSLSSMYENICVRRDDGNVQCFDMVNREPINYGSQILNIKSPARASVSDYQAVCVRRLSRIECCGSNKLRIDGEFVDFAGYVSHPMDNRHALCGLTKDSIVKCKANRGDVLPQLSFEFSVAEFGPIIDFKFANSSGIDLCLLSSKGRTQCYGLFDKIVNKEIRRFNLEANQNILAIGGDYCSLDDQGKVACGTISP